jgi:ADP-ribose pyrophosphatase
MRTPPRPITTTAVTKVYSSPWVQVEEHTVIDVDNTPGMYNVVRCGDGVSVLAVSRDGEYFLIREYKYAIGKHILQLPSGSIDPGEEPLQAARRELLEETGLTAQEWMPLGMVYPYPTNIASAVHLFLASGASPVRQPEPGIEILRLPQAEVQVLIAGHEITHAGSPVCILLHLSQVRR